MNKMKKQIKNWKTHKIIYECEEVNKMKINISTNTLAEATTLMAILDGYAAKGLSIKREGDSVWLVVE